MEPLENRMMCNFSRADSIYSSLMFFGVDLGWIPLAQYLPLQGMAAGSDFAFLAAS